MQIQISYFMNAYLLLWNYDSRKFLLRCFKKFKIKETNYEEIIAVFLYHSLWKWFP